MKKLTDDVRAKVGEFAKQGYSMVLNTSEVWYLEQQRHHAGYY